MSSAFPIRKHLPVQKNDPRSSNFQKTQEVKLRKAAQMYEQRFLGTLVQQMRKTVPKSGLVKQSFAERIYEQKLDENYVDKWTNKGGIGLADMIYDQLHAKMFPKRVAPQNGAFPIEKNGMHKIEQDVEPAFQIIRDGDSVPKSAPNSDVNTGPEEGPSSGLSPGQHGQPVEGKPTAQQDVDSMFWEMRLKS